MISGFGVEHIAKVAWKSFYPVPPGVGKIPRGKLVITSEAAHHGTVDHDAALKHRPGNRISRVSESSPRKAQMDFHHRNLEIFPARNSYVTHADTERGFRRRGVAANLLAEARKLRPVDHSTARSALGEKFARGTDGKAIPRSSSSWDADRQHKLPRSKRPLGTKSERAAQEPYVDAHGVQRNRAYRPQTTSRVRRGR